MPEQRHIIKRQIIELEVQGSGQAQLLQDEISRIYRQRIVPLIDQHCSELSGTDRLYRIETLAVDLGTLDLGNLEDDFVAKVDTVLRRELSGQINQQEQSSAQPGGLRAQSQLELFALFARTGALPWWANASHSGLLADNLDQLLRESSGALGGLLQELAREPHPRQRMINHYTDEQLTALCGLLVPEYRPALKRDFDKLLGELQNAGAGTDSQSARFRQSLWNNILMVAGLGGQQHASLEAFYAAALKRAAAELGIIDNGQLAQIIARLAGAAPPAAPAGEALAGRLAELQTAGGTLSEAWARLRASLPQLPSSLHAALLAMLNRLPAGASAQTIARHVLQVLQPGESRQDASMPADNASTPAVARYIFETLRAEPALKNASQKSVTTRILEMLGSDAALRNLSALQNDTSVRAVVRQVLALLRAEQSQPNGPTEVIQMFRAVAGDPNARAQSDLNKKALDLSFSEADALSVGNAGLVILWPFLASFFTHLGLMEDKHFKSLAARQRGVGLLQVLATHEAASPEYLLPLNKLLCGMELQQVFDFGPPLLDSEAQECTNLIEAVIAQAPILHNMSVAGFRGTFLQRGGLLGAHDGLRLLRVERQSYDIVLERFPWSWEWVKLPWMEAPLRVEW